MKDLIVTEYIEDKSDAQVLALDSESVIDHESFDDASLVITFDEDDLLVTPDEVAMPIVESESSEVDEAFDANRKFRLPGSNYVDDEDAAEESDEQEEAQEEEASDWEHDRDPKHFMEYILLSYPNGIPAHDGSSTLGCERAILYLTKLNKEISEALRSDEDDFLDIGSLEDIRVNMIKDVVTLKEHIKKLNKKHKKKSFNNSEQLVKDAELTKEASTPKIQLVMTPWERAITGIIINSVVSSGKPIEDVYEFLKEKYSFTDREELSIIQLLMDMGQPIFKDRGIIGSNDKDSEEGIEFITNYFA